MGNAINAAEPPRAEVYRGDTFSDVWRRLVTQHGRRPTAAELRAECGVDDDAIIVLAALEVGLDREFPR